MAILRSGLLAIAFLGCSLIQLACAVPPPPPLPTPRTDDEQSPRATALIRAIKKGTATPEGIEAEMLANPRFSARIANDGDILYQCYSSGGGAPCDYLASQWTRIDEFVISRLVSSPGVLSEGETLQLARRLRSDCPEPCTLDPYLHGVIKGDWLALVGWVLSLNTDPATLAHPDQYTGAFPLNVARSEAMRALLIKHGATARTEEQLAEFREERRQRDLEADREDEEARQRRAAEEAAELAAEREDQARFAAERRAERVATEEQSQRRWAELREKLIAPLPGQVAPAERYIQPAPTPERASAPRVDTPASPGTTEPERAPPAPVPVPQKPEPKPEPPPGPSPEQERDEYLARVAQNTRVRAQICIGAGPHIVGGTDWPKPKPSHVGRIEIDFEYYCSGNESSARRVTGANWVATAGYSCFSDEAVKIQDPGCPLEKVIVRIVQARATNWSSP